MIKPSHVLVLEDVIDDMNEGRKFYAQRKPWLGEYFWDSILSDIESLYLFAGTHQRQFGSYRLISKRFPFAIYYSIDDTIVKVIAILPMRRDPAWIKKKVSGRT